MAMVMPLRLPR